MKKNAKNAFFYFYFLFFFIEKPPPQKMLLETVEFPLPFLTVVWPTACFPSSSHLLHTRVKCVAAAQLMLNSSK